MDRLFDIFAGLDTVPPGREVDRCAVGESDPDAIEEMAHRNPLYYALTLVCYKRFLNARFAIKAILQAGHTVHVFLDNENKLATPVLRDMILKYQKDHDHQANVQFIDWNVQAESWQYVTRAMLPEWGCSRSMEFDDTKTVYYDKELNAWICKPFYYWQEIDFKAYWALQDALKKRLKKKQD